MQRFCCGLQEIRQSGNALYQYDFWSVMASINQQLLFSLAWTLNWHISYQFCKNDIQAILLLKRLNMYSECQVYCIIIYISHHLISQVLFSWIDPCQVGFNLYWKTFSKFNIPEWTSLGIIREYLSLGKVYDYTVFEFIIVKAIIDSNESLLEYLLY